MVVVLLLYEWFESFLNGAAEVVLSSLLWKRSDSEVPVMGLVCS